MTWVVVGLGNPGDEYEGTRHNAGRMAVRYFAQLAHLGPWKEDAKSKSDIVRGARGKALVVALLPNTFMNKSGNAVARFVKSLKAAEKLILVYDDLDLPFGTLKVSFDRGSGGHKGVDSVMRALKTRRFVRIRMGISKKDAKGGADKPHGEKNVEKFILGRFSSVEEAKLPDVFKRVAEALSSVIMDGREKAMNTFN